MPFIEVKGGGPDIPDGVYPVILSDIVGPRTVTAQRGPKAGQDVDLLDWKFVISDGPHAEIEIEASTSTASGPRSKMYAFLTALFGGRAPAIGTAIEKGDLVGRVALATVQKDEEGWLRITNLSAAPVMAQYPAPGVAPVAADAPPAPVQAAPAAAPTAQPLREQVDPTVPF